MAEYGSRSGECVIRSLRKTEMIQRCVRINTYLRHSIYEIMSALCSSPCPYPSLFIVLETTKLGRIEYHVLQRALRKVFTG